ncbi:MAG: family 16 glycosylhydrolase [Rikenellaceae bacterium]
MNRKIRTLFFIVACISCLATSCTEDEKTLAFNGNYPEGYEPEGDSSSSSGSSIHNVTPTSNPELFEVMDEFTEDFGADGATTFDSSKWEAYDDNTFAAWTFVKENVTVGADDGNNPEDGNFLKVTATYDPHNRTNSSFDFDFKSGIVRSKSPVNYGYYEARIKGADVWPGTCSAFWLYSIVDKESIMPREVGTIVYNEIDIIELQQIASNQRSMASNIHLMYLADSGTVDSNGDMVLENTWEKASSMPNMAQTHYDVDWYADDDYHIYGCENRPDSIVFYVDNVRIGGKKNSYWHMDEGMYITFSLGMRTPYEQYIDGVRQPTYDITEEDAIAAGFPSSMYVDYIRSYRRKDNDYSAFRNNETQFDVNDVN